MKNGNFRLDMAEESADFLKIDVKTAQKRVGENVTVRVTCVQKDEESRALNRDKGKYITVDAEKNVAYPSVKRDVTAAVKDAIRNLSSKAFKERPRVLVAGLGNRYVAADAIGRFKGKIRRCGRVEIALPFSERIVDHSSIEQRFIGGYKAAITASLGFKNRNMRQH